MENLTLYHNPRCSKSRETLTLLEQHGVKPTVILYLDTPPSEKEIKQLLIALGFSSARQLMRKKEALYTHLHLTDETLNEQQLVKILSEHPILIERPIFIKGKRACIGRPPEQVLTLL